MKKGVNHVTETLGRMLVIIGGLLLVSGLLILFFGRFVNLDELPGTIRIESGNFKLVVPILGSILVSIVLTVVLNLIVRLINR